MKEVTIGLLRGDNSVKKNFWISLEYELYCKIEVVTVCK